jgi:hypothetical protein
MLYVRHASAEHVSIVQQLLLLYYWVLVYTTTDVWAFALLKSNLTFG